jgi:hypothetical protein
MQSILIGGGVAGDPQVIAVGKPATVDPLYLASRIALRPLDYTGQGAVLGHYAVAQKSGATASIGAAGHVGRIRWAPAASLNNVFCVPLRIKAGWIVTGAVTAATPMDFDAIIARGFTVDYTTAITMANMVAVPRTNAMRAGQGAGAMASSQMGTSGPGICTTAVISGQTATLDANPFAITTFPNQPSGNATVTQAVGVGAAMQTLYECTAAGQHPVVLSANEGVVIREVTAGVVTGTVALYLQWEWAEVLVF